MISFCVTTYNTEETIEEFRKSFDGLSFPYEIIIVDNFSIDKTVEELKRIRGDRVEIIKEHCGRGKGRELAAQRSSQKYLVFLDADVRYLSLEDTISSLVKDYSDKFVVVSGEEKGTLMTFTSKKTLDIVGGFPDLNYLEDSYVWKVAKALGLYVEMHLSKNFAYNIHRGTISADQHSEARYEKSLLRLFKRRLMITRDIIFVDSLNYKGLIKFYEIRNTMGGKITTFILYIMAKFLQFTIKEPTPMEKINKIKESMVR